MRPKLSRGAGEGSGSRTGKGRYPEAFVQISAVSIPSLILWVCFFFVAVLAVIYAGMTLRERLTERAQAADGAY